MRFLNMSSSCQRLTVKFFKQLKRYRSGRCTVNKNDSEDTVIPIASCGNSKSRKTKNDEPENIWLKNLNLENLKLYRKTSFGSYRKINLPDFLEKLKVILPVEFDNKETVDKSSVETNKGEVVQFEEKKNIVASPHMCEFLIENMMKFPLLKSQCEDSFKDIIKDEDKLGKVDIMGYPSITRILQETMPDENKRKLDQWQYQMIQKMGLEKFQKFKQDIFSQGLKFHGALRKYMESRDERLVAIDESIRGCWDSVAKVLEDVNNVVTVEKSVCHPVLSYRGYIDCVASYRDVPHVIEWKKRSRKVKDITRLYDAPVQASAYLGALSWQKDFAGNVPRKCLVVMAYTNGDPADVYSFDIEHCQVYWLNFIHRLQMFWTREWPNLKSNKSQM